MRVSEANERWYAQSDEAKTEYLKSCASDADEDCDNGGKYSKDCSSLPLRNAQKINLNQNK